MTESVSLAIHLRERFSGVLVECREAFDEVTIELMPSDLKTTCLALRDESLFEFKQLMDVTVVDYLTYGISEWETRTATAQGFDRGVMHLTDFKAGEKHSLRQVIENNKEPIDWRETEESKQQPTCTEHRFAVVYHLLSLTHNQRVRLKVKLSEADLAIASVVDIWPSANWFEREAFDLFGVYFTGHPDLRRILTDYGFVGHPFRKDFPLSGHVEVRYDAAQGRVIYEPLDIVPRVLVPKIIRE